MHADTNDKTGFLLINLGTPDSADVPMFGAILVSS